MKRTLIMLGLAAVLTCGFDAAAAPSAQLREQVQVLLRAPEHTPSEKEWKALGPDAAVVLREIALNEKELVLRRGRAASALSYFDTAESRTTLTKLVKDDKAAWLLRGKAAHSLVRLDGEKSLAVVKPLLAHQHKRLREVAIKAIALVPAKASRDLLTARLPNEKNAHLRTVLKAAVKQIDARRDSK